MCLVNASVRLSCQPMVVHLLTASSNQDVGAAALLKKALQELEAATGIGRSKEATGIGRSGEDTGIGHPGIGRLTEATGIGRSKEATGIGRSGEDTGIGRTGIGRTLDQCLIDDITGLAKHIVYSSESESFVNEATGIGRLSLVTEKA